MQKDNHDKKDGAVNTSLQRNNKDEILAMIGILRSVTRIVKVSPFLYVAFIIMCTPLYFFCEDTEPGRSADAGTGGAGPCRCGCEYARGKGHGEQGKDVGGNHQEYRLKRVISNSAVVAFEIANSNEQEP